MPDSYHDLETRSPIPIRDGTHRYAEHAEVMLWAFAGEEGEPMVWDLMSGSLWHEDELSGLWVESPTGLWSDRAPAPWSLQQMLRGEDMRVWFHNGAMFDFVVLDRKMPWFTKLVPQARRRDTMVQAYCCAMPGALEKLGVVLKLDDGDRKLADEGKRFINLFCKPKSDGTYNDRRSHPEEWVRFTRYAARDIITMRKVHQTLPTWNYAEGKQMDLWHAHLRMTCRGMHVDQRLAAAAIEAAESDKRSLAKRTQVLTEGEVAAATQRDRLLKFILEAHGVELPDLRADTLERRIDDPELPEPVRELLRIRLRASMNSVSKYKTLLKGVNSDSRLRGCSQFRGAGRTGRTAHRLFQPGNLPRPLHKYAYVTAAIQALLTGGTEGLTLLDDRLIELCVSMIRYAITAAPGKKLVVADLSNIEGRVAAWLTGEDWKLDAFRRYDTITGYDAKGKAQRLGHDLYVVAYAAAFALSLEGVKPEDGKDFIGSLNRQIGKVMELMLQYQGGVGAFVTGAATYGIDLEAMADGVHDTLEPWALEEAESFLHWLYAQEDEKHEKRVRKLQARRKLAELTQAEYDTEVAASLARCTEDKVKVRLGLSEKVFITCDALKRLWRRAHPAISSYWKELEDDVIEAIQHPGITVRSRKVTIKRSGAWLRIRLPSGRFLCYPSPRLTKDGKIAYTGQNQYNKQWGEIPTYGGKLFENIVQAVANDQFMEPLLAIENEGFEPVLDIHDEWVCEAPKHDSDLNADRLAELMCADLGWNQGLPLAAAGLETDRFHKED